MNGEKLMIGWMILMVVLVVAGCVPAPVPETEEPALGPASARDAAMASIWPGVMAPWSCLTRALTSASAALSLVLRVW